MHLSSVQPKSKVVAHCTQQQYIAQESSFQKGSLFVKLVSALESVVTAICIGHQDARGRTQYDVQLVDQPPREFMSKLWQPMPIKSNKPWAVKTWWNLVLAS